MGQTESQTQEEFRSLAFLAWYFTVDCILPRRFKIDGTTRSIILTLPQHRAEFLLMSPALRPVSAL